MERKLTPMDQLFWYSAKELPVNFTCYAHVSGKFRISDLKRALQKAVIKNPLAGARVEIRADSYPWYTTKNCPPIPVRIVETTKKCDWTQFVKQELYLPFDMEIGPITRVVCSQKENDQADLIFCFHHLIADGISAITFLKDTLMFLGDEELETFPVVDKIGLDYNIPDIEIDESNKLPEKDPQETELDETNEDILITTKFHMFPQIIEEDLTTDLLRKCKEYDVSIHSALNAALLKALIEIYYPDIYSKSLKIQSPISLRNYLTNKIGDVFGCYITLKKIDLDFNYYEDFWVLAKKIKEKFIESKSKKNLFPVVTQIREIANKSKVLDNFIDNIKKIDFASTYEVDFEYSLSNLGRIDLPATFGNLRLKAVFAPTFSAGINERVIGALTFDHKLFINYVTRCNNLVEAEKGLSLLKRMKEIIKEVTRVASSQT